jgi:RimJ/RimL family protein N-acetyltransferase
MFFQFRPATTSDLPLYKHCFANDEFHYMLYNREPINIDRYVNHGKDDFVFICSIKNTQDSFVDFGFVHFYYKEENNYTYVGGLIPEYFNSGLGVYTSIAILDYMFSQIDKLVITTGVFKHNIRSLKMLNKMGFYQIKENNNKHILKLTKDEFNNNFVKHIRKKIYGIKLL